ncbi:MAG: hypothetical protein LUG99_00205 [Lachnospiraceae bacterium]|nr:hypothetical protein [Lachnospiraceae bacterium]
MNEVFETLPALQERYRDYNLLLPTATDVQLNPFYKYHVEEVPVDTTTNSGDIFKVGSLKNTLPNGKEEYVDMYSLSKPLLNKLAMAAGIQFNPKETYGERLDRITYRAQAQGALKKADGTARTETDQKVICLEDEEDKYKIEFADKAVKGITDKKAADAAAELFAGKWVEVKNKWGRTVNAYVIDEKDRERYIERSVKVNMALLKKTWAEKAMTGAKLRVIRALLGLKGAYTLAELKKNFAIPTVVFSPDYSDPQVRQAMLDRGLSSMNNMFGIPEIPVKRMDFDSDTICDVEADMENPAFTSESDLEGADVTESATQVASGSTPPDLAPTSVESAYPERSRVEDFQCSRCGAVINEKVYEYSINKFGEPLCFSCQKKGGRR